MHDATEPTHDKQLAARLGTDRKSLRRWRTLYGRECPPGRGVAAWEKFMRDNCLGPFSARMGWGESRLAPSNSPQPSAPAPPSGEKHAGSVAERRRVAIFAMLDVLHDAHADGQLDLLDYFEIGEASVEALCAVSAKVGAEIDGPGWRGTWRNILAGAALKQEAANARRQAVGA